MNYTTSINTGGFGQDMPAKIAKLRAAPGDGGLAGSLFNLSPYQRDRINPQQRAEMGSQFADTNRAARWDAANDLDRTYQAANQQARLGQLGAATDLAQNFFGTAQNLGNQQRQIGLDNVGMLGSLMSNLFGRGW